MRKKYIDILKVIFAFCIVLLHINSNTLHLVYGALGEKHKMIANTLHQTLYLGVPVFVILTGCGVLSGKSCTYKKMWPNIRKIICCIVVFGLIFEISRVVVRKEVLTPLSVLSDLANGTTWSHMWYLNEILGVYLLSPVLNTFLNNCKRIDKIVFFLLCLIFSGFLPYLSQFIQIRVPSFFPISGMFVSLALIGHLIEEIEENDLIRFRWVFLIGLFVSLSGIILICINNANVIILENHPFSFMTAICVVLFFKSLCLNKQSGRVLEEISRCTFGIYIIHPILLHLMVLVFQFNPHTNLPVITLPLMGIVIFASSFLIVWGLRRIPLFKYIL